MGGGIVMFTTASAKVHVTNTLTPNQNKWIVGGAGGST